MSSIRNYCKTNSVFGVVMRVWELKDCILTRRSNTFQNLLDPLRCQKELHVWEIIAHGKWGACLWVPAPVWVWSCGGVGGLPEAHSAASLLRPLPKLSLGLLHPPPAGGVGRPWGRAYGGLATPHVRLFSAGSLYCFTHGPSCVLDCV